MVSFDRKCRKVISFFIDECYRLFLYIYKFNQVFDIYLFYELEVLAIFFHLDNVGEKCRATSCFTSAYAQLGIFQSILFTYSKFELICNNTFRQCKRTSSQIPQSICLSLVEGI